MKFTHLVLLVLLPLFAVGQNHPPTNVYLFNYQQVHDSLFKFSRPKFLTKFNLGGYNNQPAFFNDHIIYLTSTSTKEGAPDIVKLNLAERTVSKVTSTPEGEYSATNIFSSGEFSVIKTEPNGVQRLWKLPIDRSTKGEPILNNMTNIGYHFWLNKNKVALFMVDEPHYLAVADTRDNSSIKLTSYIGRCFQKLPNGNLAYVYKATDSTWYIQELNISNYKTKILTKTKPGAEDFVILRDGTILMGSGSTLFKFHPSIDSSWLPIIDLANYGITKITRMAVNKTGKIAIVSE